MAMYSIMRDIHDAMKGTNGKKYDELLFTDMPKNYKWNQMLGEQWAFENGLHLFDTHCI